MPVPEKKMQFIDDDIGPWEPGENNSSSVPGLIYRTCTKRELEAQINTKGKQKGIQKTLP
jgi:hypothetical protein